MLDPRLAEGEPDTDKALLAIEGASGFSLRWNERPRTCILTGIILDVGLTTDFRGQRSH